MPEIAVPVIVRDLTHEDLAQHAQSWGWTDTYIRGVTAVLERAECGEVNTLAVCPPSGIPVATGSVDFTKPPGSATLFQLSVDTALRGCGIGTVLVQSLEQRIRDRGVQWAALGVDENHSRPQRLYERLGYVVYDREPGGWDEEAPDGSVRRYETTITLLRKRLS